MKAANNSEELREKGNQCLKEGKHAEAILHYTHALATDRDNSLLYGNRSLAFLKMDQFYLAYEDARQAIRLSPNWPKGYYRKAEVEFRAEHYKEAMESFRKALQLSGDDPKVLDQLRKSRREFEKQTKVDSQIPWMGAATGFVLGVLIVVFDVGIRKEPYLLNPIWMTAVVMTAALICFFIARFHRNSLQGQRKSLLEPPVDLFGEGDFQQESEQAAGGDGQDRKEPKLKKR